MRAKEIKLEMIRRHVRQGERLIAEQHARIAHLNELGLPTEEAKNFLLTLEDAQRQHQVHLAETEAEQAKPLRKS